jgi:hypothetical protein
MTIKNFHREIHEAWKMLTLKFKILFLSKHTQNASREERKKESEGKISVYENNKNNNQNQSRK